MDAVLQISFLEKTQNMSIHTASLLWERPLMTSNIRVGRGSKIAPKIGRYRVGQGRSKMAKKHGTSLMDVPFYKLLVKS